MKEKLLNAITIDLIDQLDFVPMEDHHDTLFSSGEIQLFEKRDIAEYSIVELIDLDCLSEDEISNHFTHRTTWVNTLAINDFTGKPSLILIYIMQKVISSKVKLIQSLENSAIDQGLKIAFVIIDISNNDLVRDWGILDPLPEIEDVLWYWLDNDPSQYDTLPDLESIVNRHEPEPVLEFVAKTSPSTYVLLALNVLVWLLGGASYFVYGENYINFWGIKNNALILDGQYWRILTPVFLHSDITHLATNCLSLLIFGNIIERVFGTRKYLLIYFISGITGNLMSFALSLHNSLGASGAVLGIGGALIYLWTKNRYFFSLHRKPYLIFVFMIFYNLFYGFISPGIDNYAHIGGFMGGFLTASILNLKSSRR